MDELPRPERYDVSSPVLPGLSKLIEELGEVLQVAGKYLAVDGQAENWDGNLDELMADELGDALAAINWFMHYNFDRINQGRVIGRREAKLFIYDRWREERLTVVCSLCQGDACEEGCGQGGKRPCEYVHEGPDSHKVCNRCGGRGRVMVTIALDDWLEYLDSLPPTEAGKCGWSGCPGTADQHESIVVDLSNTGQTYVVYANSHHRGAKTWWAAYGRSHGRYFPYADLAKALDYARRRVEAINANGREAIFSPTHVVRRRLEQEAAAGV